MILIIMLATDPITVGKPVENRPELCSTPCLAKFEDWQHICQYLAADTKYSVTPY